MGDGLDSLMDSWDWGEHSDFNEANIDIVCKYCGETELTWVHTGTRWKLVNADGDDHVCPDDDPANDFEDLGDLR